MGSRALVSMIASCWARSCGEIGAPARARRSGEPQVTSRTAASVRASALGEAAGVGDGGEGVDLLQAVHGLVSIPAATVLPALSRSDCFLIGSRIVQTARIIN